MVMSICNVFKFVYNSLIIRINLNVIWRIIRGNFYEYWISGKKTHEKIIQSIKLLMKQKVSQRERGVNKYS